MKRLWSIAKWFLIAWGAICLFGAVGVVGLVAFKLGPGNTESAQTASRQDIRYVLNWCNLGDERIEEVINSYVSARSFTGDHLDAHQIRIAHVDLSELVPDEFGKGWTRCDKVDGVLKDAIHFVQGWLHRDDISWFLTEDELRSQDVFVYPWSIYCHGTRPTAVELIFVRPKDKMVFFISSKV
jgi:hypothetical protein